MLDYLLNIRINGVKSHGDSTSSYRNVAEALNLWSVYDQSCTLFPGDSLGKLNRIFSSADCLSP